MLRKIAALCIAVACFAGDDVLYALTNKDGDLLELSKRRFYPPSKEATAFTATIYKNNSSYYSLNDGHYNNALISCNEGLLSDKNILCKSPFYSVKEAFIVSTRKKDSDKIDYVSSTVTNALLVPLATVFGTIMVSQSFNYEKYNAFLDKYALEQNKKLMFQDLAKSSAVNFKPCDIAYHIPDDKIIVGKNKPCSDDTTKGLYVYASNDSEILGANSHPDFLAILDANENFETAVQKVTQRMVDSYMNLQKEFPPIPLPKELPEVVLTKGEFEKQSEFIQRRNNAIQKRKDEQKELNEEYIAKVKERNDKFFKELQYRKQNIQTKINDFRKTAFLALAPIPIFFYESYDADEEKLYGYIFLDSKRQKVTLSVAPKIAQKIKYSKSNVAIQYELKNYDSTAIFEITKLTLHVDGDKIAMNYTDINYTPTYMAVKIPSYDIKSFDFQIKQAYKDAANIDISALKALQDIKRWQISGIDGISDTKIVRTNAKAPAWYNDTECINGNCAVARGASQEEALKIALAQLGCKAKSTVISNFKIEKTDTSGYFADKKSYTVEQICEDKIQGTNITISNVAEMDGWYYVKVAF